MSSYEKREEELRKELALIKPQLPEEEHKRLEETLKQYCEIRDDVLNRMFLISTDTSYNKRESDWKDLQGKARDAVKSKLEDSLSSFREPSPSGWTFANGTAVLEHKFWSSLEKLNMGMRRDDMMLLTWNLEQKSSELEKKWETVQTENKALLVIEKRSSEIVKVTLDRAIEGSKTMMLKVVNAAGNTVSKIEGVASTMVDIIAEWFKKYAGIDKDVTKDAAKSLVPTVAMLIDQSLPVETEQNIIEPLLTQAEQLPVAAAEYKKQVDEHHDKYRRQIDSIAAAFRQTRQETDEFVKKNGYEVAKKLYEETRSSLNSWSNELLTNGLKDDGKIIVEKLTDGLGRHLLAMESMFNNFVKANEGRFFGSVKADVEEALAETRVWDDELKMLLSKGKDLEETLRQCRSDLQRLEADLNAAFAEVESEVRRQPEEVKQEVLDLIEKFREEMMRKVKAAFERVDDLTAAVLEQISMQKLREDFGDRSALIDAVHR